MALFCGPTRGLFAVPFDERRLSGWGWLFALSAPLSWELFGNTRVAAGVVSWSAPAKCAESGLWRKWRNLNVDKQWNADRR